MYRTEDKFSAVLHAIGLVMLTEDQLRTIERQQNVRDMNPGIGKGTPTNYIEGHLRKMEWLGVSAAYGPKRVEDMENDFLQRYFGGMDKMKFMQVFYCCRTRAGFASLTHADRQVFTVVVSEL